MFKAPGLGFVRFGSRSFSLFFLFFLTLYRLILHTFIHSNNRDILSPLQKMTESPETHEHPETNGQTDISSIHARIKVGPPHPNYNIYPIQIFENPFAYQVLNTKVELYCSHCMRPPKTGEKLMKCAGYCIPKTRESPLFRCDFIRYCSKDCQRLAWKVHRPECRRLKAVCPGDGGRLVAIFRCFRTCP